MASLQRSPHHELVGLSADNVYGGQPVGQWACPLPTQGSTIRPLHVEAFITGKLAYPVTTQGPASRLLQEVGPHLGASGPPVRWSTMLGIEF